MFHTICLFKRILSFNDYRFLDTTLSKFSQSFTAHTDFYTDTHDYELRRFAFTHFTGLEGISMYLSKKKTFFDNFYDTKSYLHMVINPKVILRKDYISVANSVDAVFALHEIDRLFNHMGIPLMCADFKTARIDCCFNHQFLDKNGNPSDDMARDYIKLLKRGKMPANFEKDIYYSKSGKRFIPPKNSLRYTQHHTNHYGKPVKSVVINIYNKYEEIRQRIEMPSCTPFDGEADNDTDALNYEYERDSRNTLANAHGIVRFEVQLYYQKLYNLTRSSHWNIDSLEINNFIRDDFTEQILLDYLKKISFTGDYYMLEVAKRMAIETSMSRYKETNDNLLTLLSQVSKKGWETAVERLTKPSVTGYGDSYLQFSPGEIKYLSSCLDKNGINVVTIPNGGSSDFFYSPVNIVKNAIQNYKRQHPYEIVPILSYEDFNESIEAELFV